MGAHYKSEVLDLFKRIDRRGGRVPNRETVREMREDKGSVEGEESLWRSALIEVAIK